MKCGNMLKTTLGSKRFRFFVFILMWPFISHQQNSMAASPVNDMFASATVISGTSGSTTGTNLGATAETGEPDHGGLLTPIHSVWFKWTAPSNNPVIFDTNGSTFDNVLAAHTGPAVYNLTPISNNFNSGVGYNSQILFTPVTGHDYFIAVDSFETAQGQVALNWGPANYISGTVSLPGGQVAPFSGISVTVILEYQHGEQAGSQAVYIPAGSSSVPYTIPGVLDPKQSLTVSYAYGGNDYLRTGYYSSNGTQWSYDRATYFGGGANKSGINLSLLSGNSVYGSLSLPSAVAAPPGGTSCIVYVLDEDFYTQQSHPVTIAAGDSSVLYTIPIPNSHGAKRTIMGTCTHSDIYSYVYYNSSGSEWDQNGAQLLSGGRDYTNINMIFFPTVTISGTLSRPGGDVAAETVNTSIVAATGDTAWPIQQLGNISSGSSTWNYSLTIPSDPTANWRVSYWSAFTNVPTYLYQGFYSGSTTHWNPANAQLLAGGIDHANIDLTVIPLTSLETITISGRLYIPNGETAPAAVYPLVQIMNPKYMDNRFEESFAILQGQQWGDFTFEVPKSSSINWIARYYGGGKRYIREGFYGGSKTVCSKNNAAPINSGKDQSGVNLYLLNECDGLTCFPVKAKGNRNSMICF